MMTAPLPALRVVPLEQCVLHEETDPTRVSRLVTRLTSEGVLRNPPILGRLSASGQYMVLDGSTRVTALRSIGVEHIFAQVVEYGDPAIQLDMWAHVLSNASLDHILAALGGENALRVRLLHAAAAEATFRRGEGIAYLVDGNGRSLVIDRHESLRAEAAALRRLFASYAGNAAVVRVPGGLWRERLEQEGADVAVIFPQYTKQDLALLAQAGALLPAGITRHIIPGRVLHLNAPLDILYKGSSVAEKQAWLDAWVGARWSSQRVRYYQEPTYIFDE